MTFSEWPEEYHCELLSVATAISLADTPEKESKWRARLATCDRLWMIHLRVSSQNWPCQLPEHNFSPSSTFDSEKPVSFIQR